MAKETNAPSEGGENITGDNSKPENLKVDESKPVRGFSQKPKPPKLPVRKQARLVGGAYPRQAGSQQPLRESPPQPLKKVPNTHSYFRESQSNYTPPPLEWPNIGSEAYHNPSLRERDASKRFEIHTVGDNNTHPGNTNPNFTPTEEEAEGQDQAYHLVDKQLRGYVNLGDEGDILLYETPNLGGDRSNEIQNLKDLSHDILLREGTITQELQRIRPNRDVQNVAREMLESMDALHRAVEGVKNPPTDELGHLVDYDQYTALESSLPQLKQEVDTLFQESGPVLADALEEAGYKDQNLLSIVRNYRPTKPNMFSPENTWDHMKMYREYILNRHLIDHALRLIAR